MEIMIFTALLTMMNDDNDDSRFVDTGGSKAQYVGIVGQTVTFVEKKIPQHLASYGFFTKRIRKNEMLKEMLR